MSSRERIQCDARAARFPGRRVRAAFGPAAEAVARNLHAALCASLDYDPALYQIRQSWRAIFAGDPTAYRRASTVYAADPHPIVLWLLWEM